MNIMMTHFFTRHRITRILAVIIGVEALLVMAGWIFGIEPLTRIAPFGINMKFITAFLFLFCALALYFMSLAVQQGDERALLILPGISLIIFLVTMTLLVSRMLGTPTGIEDLFLFHRDPQILDAVLSTEGWPSIPTMLNFVLFGVVGIISLFPGYMREAFLTYAGYFIIFIGSTAVVGYLSDLPALYYQISFSTVPMALNTALAFILLGFGLTQIYKPESQQ